MKKQNNTKTIQLRISEAEKREDHKVCSTGKYFLQRVYPDLLSLGWESYLPY